MSFQKIYVVTDAGNISPCAGIISGVFNDRKEAEKLLSDIKDYGSEKLGYFKDNDVSILELNVNRINEWTKKALYI